VDTRRRASGRRLVIGCFVSIHENVEWRDVTMWRLLLVHQWFVTARQPPEILVNGYRFAFEDVVAAYEVVQVGRWGGQGLL
jgi:hypothetical protein